MCMCVFNLFLPLDYGFFFFSLLHFNQSKAVVMVPVTAGHGGHPRANSPHIGVQQHAENPQNTVEI